MWHEYICDKCKNITETIGNITRPVVCLKCGALMRRHWQAYRIGLHIFKPKILNIMPEGKGSIDDPIEVTSKQQVKDLIEQNNLTALSN